ncbi:hypothetical protein [Stutzerimonas kunmingensis]|uniref:hypothetical protein n=1 Tax=Stutzerimonas kunmingensis TaxID=1211807 RepID=UPI0028A6E427|nr:hypothetical protein [Stutzerimonas kunmingensis]
MLLLASITQNSFEPAGLSEKAQQATFEFSEDCPMNLLKAIVVGSVIFGSALSYAEDGYDRSIKFNEKFRADQKRIHGTESAEKKAGELKVNDIRQDQNNMEIKKETKAD